MVFLSNRADADFIRAETGQQRMASALAAGIAQYLPMTEANVTEKSNSKK
jgi:N-acetylmuramoyl-L-alanine amidase